MKLLITGGAGFVGSLLWPELQRAGHTVRLLVRRTPPVAGGGAVMPELVRGDLTDSGTLTTALDGMDGVVHCAALMSEHESAPWRQFHAHNVQGTAALIDASRRAGCRHFLYVSTTIVTGPSHGTPLTEEAPPNPGTSKYARSKAEAETVVRAATGMAWTIARLAPLYGPTMQFGWPQVIRQMKAGRFRTVAATGRLHLTHVDDVIAGMIGIVGHLDAVSGRVFQLAGPEPIVLNDAFGVLAAELGVALPRTIPYPVAMLGAHLLSAVPNAIKPAALRLIQPYRLRYFIDDHVYDTASARRAVGYDPRIAPIPGLRALARHIRQEG